jgi:hypothetical protein
VGKLSRLNLKLVLLVLAKVEELYQDVILSLGNVNTVKLNLVSLFGEKDRAEVYSALVNVPIII